MSTTEDGEMTCPRCGLRQAVGVECSQCGVVFRKVAGAGNVRRRPPLRTAAGPPEVSANRSSGAFGWLMLAVALVAAFLAWPRGHAGETSFPSPASLIRDTTDTRPLARGAAPYRSPDRWPPVTLGKPAPFEAFPAVPAREAPEVTAGTPVRTPYTWYEGASGYQAALDEARADNKPMTVYFRTDWCPHCREFDHDLLNTAEVSNFFHYIVKVRINPESGTQERAISDRYGVHSYPSIFLHKPGADGFVKISRAVWKDNDWYVASPEEFIEFYRDALK